MTQTIDRHRFRCVGTRDETARVRTYFLASVRNERVPFEPGQFLNLTFRIEGQKHTRSYSISSSCRNDVLSITVQKVQGGLVSNWLYNNFKLGCVATATEPRGLFIAGIAPKRPICFLTAGSGITPVASMLRSYADTRCKTDIVHLHCASSPEDLIFKRDMESWVRDIPQVRIIPIVTRALPFNGWVGVSGRLTEGMLRGLIPDINFRQVFSCGPLGFMARVRQDLAALGCSPDALHEEEFVSEVSQPTAIQIPARLKDGEGHLISFRRAAKSVRSPAASTLVNAAKSADVHLQTSCGKGICGTCRVKLSSGSVDMLHKGGITQREIDAGYVLACCSRPKSDVVVDL